MALAAELRLVADHVYEELMDAAIARELGMKGGGQ
jgi:hypothetical protein